MSNLNDLSVNELQSMIENAEAVLKAKEASHRKEVYAQIRELAASVGATVEISRSDKKQGSKVDPKYRNPDNPDETWTGRGLMPKWMRALIESGRDKSEFLI